MRVGLRGRFVLVLALISALTLAVAAIALLSPLDHLLRGAARDRLAESVRSELGDFTQLPAAAVRRGDPRLLAATLPLRRTGADVAVLDASGRVLVSTDPGPPEPFPLAPVALRTGRLQARVTGPGTQAEAEAAVPIKVGGVLAVVAVRRPVDDVQDVTGVVQRAFVVAALAGLLGAILAGVFVARRTAGRILRLRDTAERVAQVGPVAEFRAEGGRDEIGDLSRTFAVMQTRLREQEQARRTFVSTASHELRTPVTSLQLILDLLIEDLEADPIAVEDARRQARSADEQAARLSQLASDLLDVSRIDAGLALRSEPVDLGEVLRSVLAELEARLAEQGRTVVVDGGTDRWALGDPGSVAQIVRILLDNALRHTAPPGGVRAELTVRGGGAGIAVQDEGEGVAPEDRERIFQRFARGADAQPGGVGLGLAIARELARQMDGDLILDETALGARFVLWLPRPSSSSAADDARASR